jgi:hypothetical protein
MIELLTPDIERQIINHKNIQDFMFRPDPKPVKQPKKANVKLTWDDKKLKKLARKMALDVNKLGFKGKHISPKRKPIKKVSKAMSKKLAEYSRLKKEFIQGKTCPIYPHLPVADIHHMRGRSGEFLLDTMWWLAVSRKGHIKIENNPKWARDNGYSFQRS